MTGLSDDNGSSQTAEEQVFKASQESLNLQISESQPPMEVSESEIEPSLHLQMSDTQSVSSSSCNKISIFYRFT